MMSNLFTTNMLIAKEGASENCLAISGLQCSPTKKSFKRQKNPISLLGPSSLPEAPFILEIIRQYLWSTRSDREKEKKKSAESQASCQTHQPGRSQPWPYVIAMHPGTVSVRTEQHNT